MRTLNFFKIFFLIMNLNFLLNLHVSANEYANFEQPNLGHLSDHLGEKIRLRISCKDLPKMDVGSHSDPYVNIYVNDRLVGRTEVIDNEHNPKFKKTFVHDWRFETPKSIRFEIMDLDGRVLGKSDDFIGKAQTQDSKIGANVGRKFSLPLQLSPKAQKNKERHAQPQIIIFGEQIENHRFPNAEMTVYIRADKLPKMDGWFGKADPYLQFFKIVHNEHAENQKVLVDQTKIIYKNLNPNWGKVRLNLWELTDGDLNTEFFVKVMDKDNNSNDDLIGTFAISAQEILDNQDRPISIEPPISKKKRNKSKKSKKSRGYIYFSNPKIHEKYNFLDYIASGTSISMMVAIDFTGSNGSLSKPGSLHYSTPENPSQYERAVMALGQVLDQYDSDHIYQVTGFGAYSKYDNSVSKREKDYFPLNQAIQGYELRPNMTLLDVLGVNEIISSLYHAKSNLTFSGPTNFAPTIKESAQLAKEGIKEKEYKVLIIITDGDVTDLEETTLEIQKASNYPLSIIIVGVGSANFSKMNYLDGDDNGIYDRYRDIVQFVPFKNYLLSRKGFDQEGFVKAVLEELPGQLVDWMSAHNVKPTYKKHQSLQY